MKTSAFLLAVLAAGASAFALEEAAQPAAKPTAEQLDFFEKKIRPVFADKCYKCHSEKADKVRGGLLLDTRENARRGGDNGPAVVPGNLKDSLLIDAIRYSNKDTAMPPEKAGGKLPDAVIADFEKWITMGAPDPRDGEAKVVKKYDTSEAKKWWAYQPVQKPATPAVKDTEWSRGDIDKFVLAGLEAKDLKPVADADKLTLLRRVYFDLIGLPPAPKEIDAFARDTAPDALAKVVDRLLASPQFGERWGRHWLDVARYAESSGKDVNLAYPHAWRYRDYVINAFNEGKPFDEFVREQIAGDLLPAKDDREKADHVIATGFLAIGAKGHNEQNPKQFCLDLADEQIDTMSQAFLGLTVACARCHDHKFEPIPQRDYYALAGIFLSTDTRWGTASGIQNRHSNDLLELPRSAGVPVISRTMSKEERTKKQETFDTMRTDLEKSLRDRFQRGGQGQANAGAQDQQKFLREATITGFLEADLKSFDDGGHAKALAMGTKDLPASSGGMFGGGFFGRPGPPGGGNPMASMRERLRARPPEFASIGDARLYARGDVEKPTDRVPRGVPAILSADQPLKIPSGTSGRRELADWLVSKNNPLTARVFVNRAWHWLFGDGIVESCDNFGTTGKKPANQALLDALATSFVDGGWNVKALVRDIVLSHAYALSSTYDAKSFQADPENALVWRANKRRLDAECLRDAMLAVSGDLSLSAHTASVIGENGEGPIGGARGNGNLLMRGTVRPPGTPEDAIVNASGNYRSVYLPIARDTLPDILAAFDFPEPSLVAGARETTNVPSQALFMLNSPFAAAQAQKLGERVCAAYPAGPNGGVTANLDQRVAFAYWLVFGRGPDPVERKASAEFFSRFPSNYAKGDSAAPGMVGADGMKAAWTSFCRALFASAEFRYVN
ncbi:MAG: PSD1 and planctomycete cytochrome C domain-containing protein [Chthoniobacteraceae bacterium]